MNATPSKHNNAEPTATGSFKQLDRPQLQQPQKKPLTFGQRLADAMASKVGSWPFLIGQSTILVGWVSCNLIPGLPHWDESPFILLNLMFSFASAYTAPIVLMSQNRQSEEDRESANHNYQVTLQAAQNLELLHTKLETEYSKKIDELSTLIKQQQQVASEHKVIFVPVQMNSETQGDKLAPVSVLNHSPKGMAFVNVTPGQPLGFQFILNNDVLTSNQ